VAGTTWKTLELEQVAGRSLTRLAGLFSSRAFFDFLVSKIGQEKSKAACQ
jgi:hypothetical protein